MSSSPDGDAAIPITRVPISMPCQVRVLPGTPITDVPVEIRTELCATDAWWMVGRRMICTGHLRAVIGEGEFAGIVNDLGVAVLDEEFRPWRERRRYVDAVAVT